MADKETALIAESRFFFYFIFYLKKTIFPICGPKASAEIDPL